MILHLYFARRFALMCLGLAVILFCLTALVDLVDLLRDFSKVDDIGFGQIFQLMLLKTPGTLNQILPLILLLATITLFINFARSSEMVVTRAAGRSATRALFAPVTVAFLIGVLAVTSLGPMVAAFSNRFSVLSESYQAGGTATLSVSSEGLWLRQGSDAGQSVIRAARSNADASILYDVTFLTYAPNGGPVQRLEAASAALLPGLWSLQDVKQWPLMQDTNPEAAAQRFDRLEVPSTLTLDRIRESLGAKSGISLWDMSEFIAQLEQAGFSAQRHRVWFQAELSRPLFLVAMVLVGAAFTMRHTRLGGTGLAVVSAVLLGFAMYFVRSFATILGENGQLGIYLSTWAVPIAAILLAFGLILHAEDG
ncbi:MAG: LPS export ABC transporter permease LptG [Paracoccaceae bacterium]